jgi:uncharacterized protein (TIGR03435 family)
MQRTFLSASLLVLSCGTAFGQASLSFEVASVKPAEPPSNPGMIRVGMRGGPGTPDPGQITYTNVSFKNLLMNAYNVKGYQLTGPKWLDNERFDIVAKVPKGATKEEARVMLQNLLAERFKLSLHRETKELPIYALVVGKNGSKLKESADQGPDPASAAATPAPGGSSGGSGPSAFAPPVPAPQPASGATSFGVGGGAGGAAPPRISVGADGQIKLPPGMGKGGMMMMIMNGRMKMVGNGQPVGALVEAIANQMGRPVVDETGLKAKYDFDLDFAPEGTMGGPMGMMPPAPSHDGGGGGGPIAGSPDGAGPSFTTALKEQLGLQLESKKGPVEMLIIDRLEKTPIEN